MTNFKFLHAADLHLDSPLLGLAGKSAEFAATVERASRVAFDNLVALAIDEGCRFLVLAGDVFDGDLRNFQTGLFFLTGMTRLKAAGIRVFLIAGNHDAENRFAGKLSFSDNVHVFAHKRAESVPLDELDVTIHGRSFGQQHVLENIAREYPSPQPNRFNIGVLHTACQGSEGHHAVYAPCSLEQLVTHGYDYWALGHVHDRAVLNTHPHVVYPGNLQGRNPREIGAKGATLVGVADNRVVRCEHRDLDVVRWASETVDISGAADRRDVLALVRQSIEAVCGNAGERPVALRLRLSGETAIHSELLLDRTGLRDDVEALLATLPNELWLEKLALRTRAPSTADDVDPTIAGRLQAEVRSLGAGGVMANLLEDCLAEIRTKMPAGARVEDLFAQLRAEAPARALDLALSLVGETEAAGAPR